MLLRGPALFPLHIFERCAKIDMQHVAIGKYQRRYRHYARFFRSRYLRSITSQMYYLYLTGRYQVQNILFRAYTYRATRW